MFVSLTGLILIDMKPLKLYDQLALPIGHATKEAELVPFPHGIVGKFLCNRS